MTSVAKGFARVALLYFVFAVAVVFLLRDNPLQYLYNMLLVPLSHWTALKAMAPYILLAIAAVLFLSRLKIDIEYLGNLLITLIASLFIAYSFGLMKASLPLVWPFYADGFFTDVDRWLHFGADPWVLTHRLSSWISTEVASTIYLKIWAIPAFSFPVLLIAIDRDARRVSRFLLLYVLCWIGLGNILALLGLSVGPVYVDRYDGGSTFAPLTASLSDIGISQTVFGYIQEQLWHFWVEYRQEVGTGISAFPSVHVGIASVVALYGIERGAVWAIAGILFCLTILFLSVYLGWHYAVDGYFSIAAVALVWRMKLGIPAFLR